MRLLVLLIIVTAKCNGRTILQEQILSTDNPVSSTTTTSTTLDPWIEFCKEACEEGLAGPECDCPDHGIRQNTAQRYGDIKSSENSNMKSYKNIHSLLTVLHTLLLKSKITNTEYIKIKPSLSITDNNLKSHKITETEDAKVKSSLTINENNLKPHKNMTTDKQSVISGSTLDPWDEFCLEACEEGLAGPECDCPEHPIG
ncbi:unnamed protein product [Meganyctiphanes norvegica]|uniref:Secreted protein n=1 Tax=Meganyctiphanes norvegica TaxID=48144 RepID=A0AAV2S1A2_MEGNR